MQTDEHWNFVCDKRLTADEKQPNVEYKLELTKEQKFRYTFRVKVLQGLRDQHPWASIFTCDPRSTFSRVQRLSCCFGVVMSAMFINIIFYEKRSKSSMLETLRSYKLEQNDVIIGAQSALLNVPINILIVLIFRWVAPRKQPFHLLGDDDEDSESDSSEERSSSSDSSKESSSSSEFTGSVVDSSITTSKNESESKTSYSNKQLNKASSGFHLPWWCIIVAWALVVVKCTVSSYVTIMYGLSYGHDKSMAWLRSFVVSATSDFGVIQPAKVAITVCIFILILKSPAQPITDVASSLG